MKPISQTLSEINRMLDQQHRQTNRWKLALMEAENGIISNQTRRMMNYGRSTGIKNSR